jgi:tRNA threonylcarbamoyladenosine modification (KEOPS) complex  Pcc1 subunit
MAKASSSKSLHLRLVIATEPGLNYKRILGKNTKHSRSTVKLTQSKDTLIIEITSADTTSMRASANAILRDLQVIDATKVAKSTNKK